MLSYLHLTFRVGLWAWVIKSTLLGYLWLTAGAKCPHSEKKKNDVVILQEILYGTVVYAKEMPTKKLKYC